MSETAIRPATIARVVPDSIAAELGFEPGDRLVSINGQRPRDLIDYNFLCADEELTLEILDPQGHSHWVELAKDYDEPLGLEFESALFDGLIQCNNRCPFCFIDQQPPGKRETLYFKDDDYRLSFLYGSYLTLTNLTDREWRRIEQLRLSPLYVSVHATEPEVRVRLLKNSRAAQILDQLAWFRDRRLQVHAQVVVCPGINDGEHLDRTLRDLAMFAGTGQPVDLDSFDADGVPAQSEPSEPSLAPTAAAESPWEPGSEPSDAAPLDASWQVWEPEPEPLPAIATGVNRAVGLQSSGWSVADRYLSPEDGRQPSPECEAIATLPPPPDHPRTNVALANEDTEVTPCTTKTLGDEALLTPAQPQTPTDSEPADPDAFDPAAFALGTLPGDENAEVDWDEDWEDDCEDDHPDPHWPTVTSVAVVPVGLTRFRPAADELVPVTPEIARATIARVQTLQAEFRATLGSTFVWLADEWFLIAGQDLPPAASYGTYPQIDNGVGSIRLFLSRFEAAIAQCPTTRVDPPRRYTWVVGNTVERAFAPVVERLNQITGLTVVMAALHSDYWGQTMTVTGLLTGQDLLAGLADRDLGDGLLLPSLMLKQGDTRFLDDVTVAAVADQLQIPIRVVGDIDDLIQACLEPPGP